MSWAHRPAEVLCKHTPLGTGVGPPSRSRSAADCESGPPGTGRKGTALRILQRVNARLLGDSMLRLCAFPLLSRSRCLSVEFWINRSFAKKLGVSWREAPAWIQELYVLLSLIFGLIALVCVRLVDGDSCWHWAAWLILVFGSLYLAMELTFFLLRWLFSDIGRVISVKRSLAGFLLNIVGITVFFAVALVGFGCVKAEREQAAFTGLYSSFRIVTTMGPPSSLKEPPCSLACGSLVMAEGAIGYLLTVVIIGAVASFVAAGRR